MSFFGKLFGSSKKTPNVFELMEQGDMAVLRTAIDNGADVHSTLPDGSTTLIMAAYYGNIEMVRLFLEHGVSVQTANQAGYTPLLIAAQKGHTDIARLLVDKGADIHHSMLYHIHIPHCAPTGLLRLEFGKNDIFIQFYALFEQNIDIL